ncbi:unnamed protein product [Cuscuta epithymum]|uniref:Uncharacterized protein n=1 Tax=Cuscuta epithymum TaxID=186058 RepID=A0AAV0DBZ1_9ASTE|nr:unnamed protein product [Cuscuta epithymum]
MYHGRPHKLIEVTLQDPRLNQILPYIGNNQTEAVIVSCDFTVLSGRNIQRRKMTETSLQKRVSIHTTAHSGLPNNHHMSIRVVMSTRDFRNQLLKPEDLTGTLDRSRERKSARDRLEGEPSCALYACMNPTQLDVGVQAL